MNTFEESPVVRAAIKVTKAGDGLSEALHAEPVEFKIGDKVFVVLETTVDKITFEPEKPKLAKSEDDRVRLHVLATDVATIIDPKVVKAALERQRDVNADAAAQREEAKTGQTAMTPDGSVRVPPAKTPAKKRAPRKRPSRAKAASK